MVCSCIALAFYILNGGIDNKYLFDFFILFAGTTILTLSNIKEVEVFPDNKNITKENSEGNGIFSDSYFYCEKCDKKYSIGYTYRGSLPLNSFSIIINSNSFLGMPKRGSLIGKGFLFPVSL